MGDWIGLIFFVLLIVGVLVGLKLLSKPVTRTEEEFERNAAASTSMLGASMNALQELMNPEAAKAKEVQTQVKEGRYMKKKREGKAGGSADEPDEISEYSAN
jgi:sensor histidine kinase regulating citrate/malate metabolism